jgi:hypothetical protein
MRRLFLLAFLLVVATSCAASAVHAQARPATSHDPALAPVAPRFIVKEADGLHATQEEAEDRPTAGERMMVRSLSGLAGWAAGALVGGYVGHHTLRRSPSDDGFGGLLIGIGVGGTVGAAFGASVAGMQDGCGGGGRFVTSLLGSAVGFGISGVVAAGTGSVLAVPLVTSVGAAVGSLACRAGRN